MTHILQSNDLLSDLILREFFADNVFVFGVIGTVDATVDAIVGKV